MNLLEYQGKQLLKDYGVEIPHHLLVSSSNQVGDFKQGVIKPQILMGGRGKAGAIQFFQSSDEAKKLVDHFLTTPIKGHLAKKILLEEIIDIEDEYYLSFYIDRSNRSISMMFSDRGGVDIESNAEEHISVVSVNPLIGLRNYHIDTLLSGFSLTATEKIKKTILNAYKLFTDKKMMLLEINPLVVTKGGDILALDAKVTLDDWYIDPEISEGNEETGIQTELEKNINSVGGFAVQLDGNIAVYAAGAGASMAMGDSITQLGGTLCTIIDKGNMPTDTDDEKTRHKVAEAMRSILKINPKVIVMNVFYQAGRVDHECEMIKLAFEEESENIPVLVR